MTATAILGLAILFFVGHFFRWFFIKTKFPDLLIIAFIGYLLGPAFNVTSTADLGKVGPVLSTLALVVILYKGGLELKLSELRAASIPALLISILGFTLSGVAAGFLAKIVFGVSTATAILFGLALGSTSSAVVIPLVSALSVQNRTKSILSLESAFTDIFVVVLFVPSLTAAMTGHFSLGSIVSALGLGSLFSVNFGLLLGLVGSGIRKFFPDLSRVPFGGEAWALLTFGAAESFGGNGALAVLSLGFCLGNLDFIPQKAQNFLDPTPVSNTELNLLEQIAFILRTVFFIYLGMLLDIKNMNQLIWAVIFTSLIFIVRYFFSTLIFPPATTPKKDAMILASMGPRGLACAVVATLPLQAGYADGLWIQETVFSIIPITIFFTAIIVMIAESPTLRRFLEPLFTRYPNNDTSRL